jgi:hypothetical protein
MPQTEQEVRLAIVGPCPRLMVETHSMSLESLVDEYASIACAVVSLSDSFLGAFRSGEGQDRQPGFHRVLFILGPRQAEDQLSLDFDPAIAPGSPFLLRVLQEQLLKHHQAGLETLLDALRPWYTFSSVVYEAWLLKQIRKGTLRRPLMLEDGSHDNLPDAFDAFDAFAPALHVAGQMRHIDPQLTTFQPVSAAFSTFDGVLFTRIFLLSVSTARRHTTRTLDLQRVIDLARQSGHPADFAFVYVVPTDEHGKDLAVSQASKDLVAHAASEQIILRIGAIVVPKGRYADVSPLPQRRKCD